MKVELELLREELEVALRGLDCRQTQLRPRGAVDKWTLQQIVGHLLLTYAATEKAMEARIIKGAPTRARVTLLQRCGQYLLLNVGYFPSGRAAPEVVCAPAGQEAVSADMLIAQIEMALSSMNKELAEAEVIFGAGRRSVSHMVLGPLSVGQWARFHLVHGRHHIKQIVAIRKQHGV